MDRCNACGSDLKLSGNNLSVCPHCDSGHACAKGKPECKLMAKWEGSGPKSG